MQFETVTTEEFKMFEKIQAYLASLDTVEMVMDLEEQLGVDLELEEKIATVGELVDFVESKLD